MTVLGFLLAVLPACSDSETAAGPGSSACAPLRNVEDVVRVYGSAWNEEDAEKRLCALDQSMIDTATYVDPTIDTANLPDLADAIGDFQLSAPKASIAQLSGLDVRSGELRFAWDFQNDGVSAITGLDYMEIASDGRIASIRGYWNPLPSEPPTGVLADYVAAWKAGDAASRDASLALAVTDDVRFTSPDATTTGRAALSDAMGVSIEVTGAQSYPKYGRVAFRIEARDDVTDYVHFGTDGKIVRIARFVGPLPAL